MQSDVALVTSQNPFINGAICSLTIVTALLLLRFYRRTRDPLFLLFSISFFLQGLGRLAILWTVNPPDSQHPTLPEDLAPYYLLRLVAYGLIIFAIIQKNRSRPRQLMN